MTVAREVTVKLNADVQKAVTDLTKAVDKITKLVAGLQKTSAATKKSSKEFSKGTKSMASSAKTLEKRLGSLRSNMTGLSESFRKISIGAVAAFGALAATASVIVKISADFELGMSKAAAVASGSSLAFGGAFKSMRKEAIKTANTTIHTAKEVTGAMEFMAMAGFNAAEVIATIGEVGKLATAANITMAESGNVLTNIMSTFGITAVNVRSELTRTTAGMVDQAAVAQELGRQLTDVNNILVGVFTNSNVNVLQLGEAFKIVGAVASAADVSFKDVAVSIGLLGNVGIQGTLAGTSLKRAFSALVKPTKQSAKAMGRLGLTTEVLRERQKGQASGMLRVIAILEKMKKKYAETGKTTQYVADLMEVFGERSGPGMAALVKQGTDAFIDLSVATKQAQFDDITTFLQNIQHETTTGKLKILKSNVESLAIAIGDLLLPKLNDLVDRVKDVVNSFSAGDGTLIRFIANYGQAALVVLAVGAAFASLAVVATGSIAAFALYGYVGSPLGITFGSMATAAGGAAFAVAGFGLVVGTALLGAELFNAALGRQGMAAIDLGYALDTASFGFMGIIKQMKAFVGLSNEIDRMELNQEIFKGADAAMRLSSADLRLDAMMDDMAALGTASSGLFQKALTVQIGAETTSFDKVSDFKKFYKELFDSIGKDSGGLFEEALNPAQMDVYEDRLNEIVGNIATTSKLLSRVDLTPKQIAKAEEDLDNFVNQLEQLRGEIKVDVSNIEEIAAKVKVTVETEGRTEAIVEKAREVSPVLQAFLDPLKELEMERLKKTLQKINDMINEGDKSIGKLLVKATEASAKQEDRVDKIGKLWDSFFDWIGGKIRSLSAKLISAFKPSMKPSIQAGAFIDKFIADAGKRLDRIAKEPGGGKLSGRSSEEIGKFRKAVGLVGMEAMRLASSFVKAADGSVRFSSAAHDQVNQIAEGMAPHIDRLNEFSKSVGGVQIAFGDLTDVVYAMAIAQEDFKKKIESASSSVDKHEKSYQDSLAALSEKRDEIQLEIAVLESRSPETMRLFHGVDEQKKSIDLMVKGAMDNAEALRRHEIKLLELNEALGLQSSASELMVATMNNLGFSELSNNIGGLGLEMKTLASAVSDNTAAVRGDIPSDKLQETYLSFDENALAKQLVRMRAEKIQTEGGVSQSEYSQALANYQEVQRASFAQSKIEADVINKNHLLRMTTLKEEGQELKSWADIRGETEFLKTLGGGGNISDIEDSIIEATSLGKIGFDKVNKSLSSIPFSSLSADADSMFASLQESISSVIDSISTTSFDQESQTLKTKVLGKEFDSKNLAEARDVFSDMIGQVGGETSGVGSSIGLALGGLIGSFASDPMIGSQIGKSIGNMFESLVMGFVEKVNSFYKAIGDLAKKASTLVPEKRFQGAFASSAKIFSSVAATVTILGSAIGAVLIPAIWMAIIAIGAIIIAIAAGASAVGQWYVWIPVAIAAVATFAAALVAAPATIIAALSTAAGSAIASFLLALGTKELKNKKILGSALDDDPGVTELDDDHRTPWMRIMDALAASIDRVIYAMGPFYENLFALVGLFDMVMEAFVIIADSLGDLDFGETLYDVFKQLALVVLDVITALAHMHNIMVFGAQVHAKVNENMLNAAQGFLDFRVMLRDIMVSILTAVGTFANNLVPGGGLGADLIDQAAVLTTDAGLGAVVNDWDQWVIDMQGNINDLVSDISEPIDLSRFESLRDKVENSSFQDGLDRFNLLDEIGRDASDSAKEFGEQLTNVPSGFKVNLARFKAMDADGEGGAVDMGGGRSIMDIDATDFFGRMAEAVRSGTAQSLGSLTDAIGSLDDVIRPDNWEDIFGHPLDRMSNELGNAFDSLTNTLGLALLGPEEAFQGGGGMGAAMGGRQAGGNITSGNNTMNININELSIADAANPDQLANMIAERSTRNQMAQAGTPFPSHQSGSGWWGGNEGGGGRS